MKTKGFGFYKRIVICYVLCVVLFFVTVLRVTTVAVADYSAVNNTSNGVRLTLPKQRGTVYDCNGERLTNQIEVILACVTPTPKAVISLREVLAGEELEEILERLKGGKPIICTLPEAVECEDIICFKAYQSFSENCRHILGYTDSSQRGVSGIERAYDWLLYCPEDTSVYYETDAKGGALQGVDPEITTGVNMENYGVVTTIDSGIQAIAEDASLYLERGAVVIAEAATGKIRAMVSRPFFDSDSVDIYLNSSSSPLLNRALNAYNVGSVFKPCVAIAGIESGLGNFSYKCSGSCEIIDRYFKCHKISGHNQLNLKKALAYSCNTYFYNFAFKIGGDNIYKTAQKLSFGQNLQLCCGITTAKGSLPTKESLKNIAYLANFSIGQGELLLSPVSMLTLYCAIASKGSYYVPSLVESTIEDGKSIKYDMGAPTQAMDSSTAQTLRKYLTAVFTVGTAENARPKSTTAGGKTATAQTGKYEKGREICSSWFCGFFPADSPEYAVVVFSEDDTKQTLSCSEIFSKIADSIAESKGFNE